MNSRSRTNLDDETLAFTPVERVSIIGIELLNLDVVVSYRLRGGTRFSSSHRNKRGQRSYQNDCRKKLRRNMSHLRLLFHRISRLYERTSTAL